MLLINNKKMALERKKELEKQNKKKKYEPTIIKKPKVEEYDSDSDSSYVSNYSYVHSSEKE
jgi:hypothetical protein